MASLITTAKQQLRAVVKKRLSNVSDDSILAQSRIIFELLKDFKPYREATRIGIYLSTFGEIQTDDIVRHALHEGKHVFVPYLHNLPVQAQNTPARVMDMVRVNRIQDYYAITFRDAWGIPIIDPATVHEKERIFGESESLQLEAAHLDLILMPGVAFDVDDTGAIRRLGHGEGFYDFFLNRYLATASKTSDAHQLKFYGLALQEQLLDAQSGEEIPMGAYDRKIHGVILGDGTIRESPDPQSISSWHPS